MSLLRRRGIAAARREDAPVPSGVQFVGAQIVTSTTTVGPISVNKPTGVASGMLLIAIHVTRGGDTDPPDGFTILREDQSGSGALQSQMWIATKTAGASEPATYDFTLLTGGGRTYAILAFSNHDGVGAHGGASSTDGTFTAPSVAGTADGLLLSVFSGREVALGTSPLPAGQTEIGRGFDGAASGGSFIAGYEALTVTEATGDRTLTPSSGARESSANVALDPSV